MLSRLGVGLAVAVCIGVTPSAAYAQFTERLSLGLEGSASTHLLAPQSDQYGFGFQAGGRFALRVAGPVAIHLFGSYARWGASTPQIPAGVMSLFGGGLRLAPEVSRSVGRFVLDLDVGVSLSGSDNAAAGTARTTALSLGGGIGWLFPVASVLSLGPIVRVHYLKSLADVSAGDRDRSLFWTAGLSVTLHGPRAEEPRRARETDLVADVVRREREDTDHDGVLDADDRCPTQPETRNNHQDDDGCPDALPTGDDTDGDQIVNANDRCADQAEDFDGFQDEDGCPEPDNDNDGVPDTQDQCADQAETRNNFQDDDGCADEPPPGAGVTVEGPRITLAQPLVVEGGALAPASQALVAQVAQLFEAHPEVRRVRVECRTDEGGNDRANRRASTQCARAVVRALRQAGVAKRRLRAEGAGSLGAAAGQARTRVEFVIIDPAGGITPAAPAQPATPAQPDAAPTQPDAAPAQPAAAPAQPEEGRRRGRRGRRGRRH